jgi:hypothetical protein
MVIRAYPEYLGLPVAGATVTATITAPDGTVTTIPMYDDGQAAHGDEIPGDGVYSAAFNTYTANGSYAISVSVDGTAATEAAGDSLLFPNEPAAPLTISPFTRKGTTSVYIAGVPQPTTQTDLAVTLTGPTDRLLAGDAGTYTLVVKNQGLETGTNVLADLHLPNGLVIGGITTTAGTVTQSGNVIDLSVPSIAPAQVVTMNVTATATATDAYFAWAGVKSGTVRDVDLTNNRSDLLLPSETAPGIAPLADVSAFSGQTVGPIFFTVSDAESPTSALTVTATSGNTTLIPQDGLVLGGSGASRTITLTAADGTTGTGAITLTVTDPGGMTYTRSFVVTVTTPPPPPPPANTPPTISPIGDVTISVNKTTGPIPFTVGDAETPVENLKVVAGSSNVNLVPVSSIVFGGSGANRTVTVTPTQADTGQVVITVSVLDGSGMAATDTFTLSVVVPPNLPPTVSSLPNITIATGASTGIRNFTVGDDQTPAESLIVTAVSSNPGLVPNTSSGIVLSGTGATRSINVIPIPGRTGTATVTITVTDGGGKSTTTSFDVTVHPSSVGGGGPTPVGQSPLLVGYSQFAAGADAGGTPQVVLYNPDGTTRYTSVPYLDTFSGGVRTATADFNGDGFADLVVGNGPGQPSHVRILDGVDQHEIFSIDPFEATFTGGVYVAAGDVNGDGVPDLIITPDEGGGPRVRVFDGKTFAQIIDFYGISDPNFRGGARAAVGDVNGDGIGDLLVAAGFQGGPRVAGWSGASLASGNPTRVFGDYFAFEQSLRNGVFIAAGDVNGDGFADVIVGGGPGGGPRVTVFDGKQLVAGQTTLLADFFAGDPSSRGGIRVAVKNLDGDNQADLVVGSGEGSGNRVTAYPGKNLAPGATPNSSLAFDAFPNFPGGVFVG